MEIARIEKKRKQRFAFLCITVALAASIGFAVVDFIEQEQMEFIVDILVIIFLAVSLIVLKKSDRHLLLYRVVLPLLTLSFLYNIAIGAGNGTAVYWLFPFPLVFFFFLGKKEGGIITAAIFFIISLLLINPFSLYLYEYDITVSLRFLASFLLVTMIAYGLEASREKFVKLSLDNQTKLMEEKQNLERALGEIKTLNGLIPICCHCKKIRNDEGYWQQVEVYVRDHTHADFSHGICPECAKALYQGYKDPESSAGNYRRVGT